MKFEREKTGNKQPPDLLRAKSLNFNKKRQQFKEGLQRLLHIGSAHNIRGLHDLEIAQILHVLNFFEHKLYLLFI